MVAGKTLRGRFKAFHVVVALNFKKSNRFSSISSKLLKLICLFSRKKQDLQQLADIDLHPLTILWRLITWPLLLLTQSRL